MATIKTVLSDPAIVVGLVRSIMILAVSFGVALSQDQVDAVLATVGAGLAFLSLALSAVTYSNTNPKTDSVLYADLPPAAIDALADDVPAD